MDFPKNHISGTDRAELPQNHNQSESLILDFSIVLSPTYCVPVLWFSCRRGSGNKSLGLDEVYDSLIPATSQASLRNVSVMGGISMAVSSLTFRGIPITDISSFTQFRTSQHFSYIRARRQKHSQC